MDDALRPGALASRDGSMLAVAVRPKPLNESVDRLALKVAVLSAINEAGSAAPLCGDAGPVTVDVAQLQSVLGRQQGLFVPLTVVIGLLLLGWVVGRLRPVVIGAVAMSSVVLPTLAAVGLSGQPYTMATAILPSLLAAYHAGHLCCTSTRVCSAPRSGRPRAHCASTGRWAKPSSPVPTTC